MCYLADEHAIYLLEKAIYLQYDTNVIENLKAALLCIVMDKNSEYDQIEKGSINKIIEEECDNIELTWCEKFAPQAITVSSKIGCEIPKRNSKKAAYALQCSNYLCE